MEGDQSLLNSNQRLNRYVYQMESEVGQLGKTLHEISSEYLALKTQNAELARAVEALELPDVEKLSTDQFNDQITLLQQLENSREQVLKGWAQGKDHPWHSFGHPDHAPEDYDTLTRTLRFVSIHLGKFWIEVQSFPLLLNTFNQESIRGVEAFFQWLHSSKPWNELIPQPRLVPVLNEPTQKKIIFDFIRNVKCCHALLEKAKTYQSPTYLKPLTVQTGLELLNECLSLVQQYQLGSCAREELEIQVANQQKKLNQIQKIRHFFSALARDSGLPEVQHFQNASPVFKAKNSLTKIPKKLLPWRQPLILAENQLNELQKIQDQVRPLLEAKKKIEAHFDVSQPTSAETLRKLAETFNSGGILRSFKTPYQEALRVYKNLLRGPLKNNDHIKESTVEMVTRLTEWAQFLEQTEAFENQPHLKALFGPLYQGIKTDFSLAIEAHQWANQVRNEIRDLKIPFSEKVLDFIFKESSENLSMAMAHLISPEAQAVQEILSKSQPSSELSFLEIESKVEKKLTDLTRISTLIHQLGIQPDLPLSFTENLVKMSEEILFLIQQVEAHPDLKQWMKGFYLGVETDLQFIEEAIHYVHFIQNARIPDSLKKAFLTVQGPQRFGESRVLAESALSSLETLKDLLKKLEGISLGQTQEVVHQPIPQFIEQIQKALKQPNALGPWVLYLKCERQALKNGLGTLLNFFESPALFGHSLVKAYELVTRASLLKANLKT